MYLFGVVGMTGCRRRWSLRAVTSVSKMRRRAVDRACLEQVQLGSPQERLGAVTDGQLAVGIRNVSLDWQTSRKESVQETEPVQLVRP